MLQIGQVPGLSETTVGCIGQWYFGWATEAAAAEGPEEGLQPVISKRAERSGMRAKRSRGLDFIVLRLFLSNSEGIS
jgi:hypothetical protein